MYGGHSYGGASYGGQDAGALVLVEYVGAGTLTYSGLSVESVTYAIASSGTLTYSGSSAESVAYAETGSGTLTFTGSADVDFVSAWDSTGVLDFSGSSEQSFTWAWAGSGEIAFEGSAEYAFVSASDSRGTGRQWIPPDTLPPIPAQWRKTWSHDGRLLLRRFSVASKTEFVQSAKAVETHARPSRPKPTEWKHLGKVAVRRRELSSFHEFVDPWAEARRQDEEWLLSGDWTGIDAELEFV